MTYVPLQVRYGDRGDGIPDGWRILAIGILLNRTSRLQVVGILPEFFDAFPTPERAMLLVGRPQVERVVASLGFGRIRADRIVRFSWEWVSFPQHRHLEMIPSFTGCGRYAQDSWRIFVDRDYSVPADDGVLEQWRKLQLEGGRLGQTPVRSGPPDHPVSLVADSGDRRARGNHAR